MATVTLHCNPSSTSDQKPPTVAAHIVGHEDGTAILVNGEAVRNPAYIRIETTR